MKTFKGVLTAGLIGLTGLLAGCGGGGASGLSSSTTTGTTTPTTATVAKLSIGTSATSVKTDNSNTATLTLSALDANNALIKGVTINLSASSGQLTSATATTDATTGLATVTFSAGSVDLFNRTATITAKVSGSTVTGSIPIQVTGSTLTTSVTSPSPNTGVPVTLAATTKLSNGNAAVKQTLRFSIATSSTGSGTFSATSASTDNNGNASATFTGTAAGVVNILIEWLDSNGNTTSSSTQTLNVQAVGAAFQITTPASSPWPVTLSNSQSVTVATPATINGTAVASIRYATTLGTWQANGLKTLTVTPAPASHTETFNAGSYSGNANIQIDALSASGTVLATAKMIFALSASVASANSITLQSNVYALAPSSGGTTSTATLTANVRDVGLNAVGGASVLFELVNPTGTGETIDPVVVSTNSSGAAQSTFTAGTSTLQTSQIKASVIGNNTVTPSTINITVGGTAGSVAIGTSTTITSVNSDTSYQLPVTVLVTDSNGNSVSGATVSLSLWPQIYHKGTRNALTCVPTWTFSNPNEDLNENLILDPGEDVDGPGNMISWAGADGALWPPSPAAGSIPATVTTGSNGTATFNWIYLKQYANWITARLRASVIVQGSAATTTAYIILAPSTADTKVSPCPLPDSPFN